MEENYYEILQVNKNASNEIIEKAYKILVKKYHPDLQKNNSKKEYEEKIKKINEAYEILSDSEKRKNYDIFLKNNEISIEEYNKIYNENIILKNEINYLKNNYIQLQNNYNHFNNNFLNNINKNINTPKNNINYNYYKPKNKIKYKIKDLIALFITILIILIIFIILWNIPITKNYLNNNPFFKFIFNYIINIFK